MGKIYGYCRISTNTQNIERQHRNIVALYPDAFIIDEVFTGTNVDGRKEWNKLFNGAKQGDAIIFDSVSRMSRNAKDGFKLYEELFNRGVELVFIKEPHINTETYKKALTNKIQPTGTSVDFILEGVNKYLLELAKEQIRLSFIQSENEVNTLKQRTREGIETARLNGKKIGQVQGIKLTTKKSIMAKEQIQKYSKDFKGILADVDVIKLCSISRNSYYKYKKELVNEINEI